MPEINSTVELLLQAAVWLQIDPHKLRNLHFCVLMWAHIWNHCVFSIDVILNVMARLRISVSATLEDLAFSGSFQDSPEEFCVSHVIYIPGQIISKLPPNLVNIHLAGFTWCYNQQVIRKICYFYLNSLAILISRSGKDCLIFCIHSRQREVHEWKKSGELQGMCKHHLLKLDVTGMEQENVWRASRGDVALWNITEAKDELEWSILTRPFICLWGQ